MIRTTVTNPGSKFPIVQRELKIFAVNYFDNTLNELKPFRLKDITHFICPFCDESHKTVKSIIKHIRECIVMAEIGLRGPEAKEITDNWTVCSAKSSHVHHKHYDELHYHLQDYCNAHRK